MKHSGGSPLTPSEKRFVVSTKQYFDRNRPKSGIKDSAAQMTADALGIGLATVNRIMAAYNKNPNNIDSPPTPRGHPKYSVSQDSKEAVRAYIRQANMDGLHVTLELVKDFLISNSHSSGAFHLSTLARTLDRWGFEFGRGIRTQGLKEKDHIIATRRRFLRRVRENRKSKKRPEVYLDESYVNKNHSNDWTWYWSEDGPLIRKPTGKGERLIIINAITEDGWVPNAKKVFQSSRKTGDYHGNMNWDLFSKWFKELLIPNIPSNSLIVLDNASYHNILSEDSAPTANCSKERIRNWLEKNNYPCKDDCLKPELVDVLRKIAPNPTYKLDLIALEAGHEVIRTPPYHPELQPIEICWGITKNEVARHCDFTMDGLKEQLEKAFKKVTAQTCKKIIKKVYEIQDNFWEEDEKLEKKSSIIT